MRKLFDRKLSAEYACRSYWSKGHSSSQPLVRLPNAIHTAVFSPSGGGKGTSLVVPFLQTCPESCVVIDFKGENALITAKLRERQFGHRIALLDPCRMVTKSPDTLNAIDTIARHDQLALDRCNDLAKALVVREEGERDPHWNDSAEAWIAAMIALVVEQGEAGVTRSLQTVRDILTNPQHLALGVQAMCESASWNGMLARLGGQLTQFVDKERSSTLTTVSRHLRFLDTPIIADSTRLSSFDPAELRSGKLTVYLILPPEHMRAQAPLLRMWISTLQRAVIEGGLQESNKVHIVLDEAASLGRMDAIDDAIDKYRGYGIRLQFYYQSLSQLRKCFPEGQEMTLLSNATQIYFGVNDIATAEQVSNRLGEKTIILDSGGTSDGTNRSDTMNSSLPSASSGSNRGSSRNWSQTVRKLLKSDEIINLHPRTAITLTPGMRPIRTTLVRYYEEPKLFEQPGTVKRLVSAATTLVKSAGLCAAMVTALALLCSLLMSRGVGSIAGMLWE
jgi:type IV secretion system protein VirD4